jgi:hypothetical protein
MYGNIDLLVSCLKNIDEKVLHNSTIAAYYLLIKEEGAKDLFIRRRGLSILSDCVSDYK